MVEFMKYLKALVLRTCGSLRGNYPDCLKNWDLEVAVNTFKLLRLISN